MIALLKAKLLHVSNQTRHILNNVWSCQLLLQAEYNSITIFFPLVSNLKEPSTEKSPHHSGNGNLGEVVLLGLRFLNESSERPSPPPKGDFMHI
mmetsp:Transcript_29515/g.38032  ORF Transcript_29515/g.38032 Transcript_29515/m.38032 type:complete len:94 (+) Transcript_29515:536-817(+)